jgi:hypothetical protein
MRSSVLPLERLNLGLGKNAWSFMVIESRSDAFLYRIDKRQHNIRDFEIHVEPPQWRVDKPHPDRAVDRKP